MEMVTTCFQTFLVLLFTFFLPDAAMAGMPGSVELTQLGRFRFQALSFFIFVFLFVSFLFQKLWNYLRKDFDRLPHLSYWRSVGFVLAWALAFNIVLAMISGARELMTPGAWELQGATYKLTFTKKQADDNK
ncbi:MAG: hypothetical protein OEY50_07915 [Nitrospinota bacterium]|nr:hypothetical protein [Nitrospinota bacterium]MDH5679238.1 hypothetical protein [Nitrospinota bacterium]MDH5757680.1 hypothetical protein [Nitrospinota bacterium]